MIELATWCLAANIYYESRGEDIAGQFAVANVTMNRAKTVERVCNTVIAAKQFSWTIDKMEWVYSNGKLIGKRIKKRYEPKDSEAWKRAVRVARVTINGSFHDVTNGATLYHAVYVKPYWSKSKKYKVVAKIGAHIFYKEG